MTHFRVPAASALTLLVVAAALLNQTVRGQTPPRQAVEVEVQPLPLGSALPCFQPEALANYLLAWSGFAPQAKCCEQTAKCDGCPATKHAIVVSQNGSVGHVQPNGTKGKITITCEISSGGLLKMIEACCNPVKVVSTPTNLSCAKCPAECCAEAAACCKRAPTVVSTTSATKGSCACGTTCACAPKTCKCGTDCACKEADKKAQRRAARRALTPFFSLPMSDGDSPLPRGPLSMLPQGAPTFSYPPPFGDAPGCLVENFQLNNPFMAPMPMPAPPRFVAVLPGGAVSCDQLVVEPCPGVQQTRFMTASMSRSPSRVGVEMNGLEVKCDRLVRNADGKLVCEGDVCMTITRANHPSKIRAERVVLNPDGSFEVGAAMCDANKPIPRP